MGAVTTDEANVIGKQVDLRWDCWKEFEGTDKAGRLSSCSTSTGTSRAMAGRRAARPRTLCRRTSTTTLSAPPCYCKLSRRECTWPRSAHASMQGAEHSNLGPTTWAPTDDPLMCMACRESSAVRDRRARSGVWLQQLVAFAGRSCARFESWGEQTSTPNRELCACLSVVCGPNKKKKLVKRK